MDSSCWSIRIHCCRYCYYYYSNDCTIFTLEKETSDSPSRFRIHTDKRTVRCDQLGWIVMRMLLSSSLVDVFVSNLYYLFCHYFDCHSFFNQHLFDVSLRQTNSISFRLLSSLAISSQTSSSLINPIHSFCSRCLPVFDDFFFGKCFLLCQHRCLCYWNIETCTEAYVLKIVGSFTVRSLECKLCFWFMY